MLRAILDRLAEHLEKQAREIVITRVFDAPRELVFEMWTDPKHLAHWYGPRGFTITIQEMDVRPGGEWNMIMHGPDGTNYPNHSVFTEVVKPERLVYVHDGRREGGSNSDFEHTVTFEGQGDRTHSPCACCSRPPRIVIGWSSNLTQLRVGIRRWIVWEKGWLKWRHTGTSPPKRNSSSRAFLMRREM